MSVEKKKSFWSDANATGSSTPGGNKAAPNAPKKMDSERFLRLLSINSSVGKG